MRKNTPLFLILLTVFIDLVGFGIVIPILPIYASKFGAGATQVGIVIAIFSLMQFISSPILGRLSDKYGRKHILAICLFGTALGYAITGFATSIILILVGRIVDGITGGNISVAQAYLADISDKKDRAKLMGYVGAAFGLGFIVGPIIGGLMGTIHVAAPFVFAGILSLLNTLGVLFFLPETHLHDTQEQKVQKHGLFSLVALRLAFTPAQVGAFVILFTLLNLAFSMIHGTVPLFTHTRFGWDSRHNGYFFAFIGVIGVVTQGFLIERLVKRFGELILTIVGFFLMGIGLIVMGAAHMIASIILAGFFISLGNGLTTATIQALISSYSSQDEQGGVMGIAQGFGALSRTAGPLYGGYVYEFINMAFPYYSGGLILLLMAISSTVSFKWLRKSPR